MLFNSIQFVVFLPIVFLLYWFVCNRNLKLQNCFVLVASYLFYGWWNWRFLILIAITSGFSFWSGILLERHDDSDKLKRWISAGNITLNLLILCVFKYFNFFSESFSQFAEMFGWHTDAFTLNIILPVGISFYTFQALSYTIDVYRKKVEATKDIVSFFAFISFFPQLVAGPIERAANLLPQFHQNRKFNYDQAVDGCRQMLWGLFKKIVIADNCAIYVNRVFDTYSDQCGSTLLLAAIFFAFQIYGDFSGYSDIAIGCARLFGFNLMRNFNYPYFSRDIAEFWRRWHISLTTWFRDYVYIPLGGSRTTKAKVIRNTFVIFLVSGFWHGANWTFVAWGAYHALLFLPLILLGKNRKYTDVVAASRVLPSLRELVQMGVTFFLVVIGWIFFRSETIAQAFDYLKGMIQWGTIRATYRFFTDTGWLWMSIFLFVVEWIFRRKQYGLDSKIKYSVCNWGVYLFIIVLLFINSRSAQSFIYFQF